MSEAVAWPESSAAYRALTTGAIAGPAAAGQPVPRSLARPDTVV